jgi:flagellar biosynthesis protein FlhF
MKLKSYFTDSVEAAVAQAGRELGPDAMIVYSRESPPEARHLGACEVVFAAPPPGAALSPEDAPGTASARLTDRSGAIPPVSSGAAADAVARELATLREQMERMTGAVLRHRYASGQHAPDPPPWANLFDRLVGNEISPEVLEELEFRLRRRLRELPPTGVPADREGIEALVREDLSGMLSADARLGGLGGGSRVAALIGPPGSGKTTALVKLAAAYALRARRPAQLLSIDVFRIGAAEQLRCFAAILGAGFQLLDTPGALVQALEEHRHKDLVLIDTPGHCGQDAEAAAELAAFLRAAPGIETHLALPASMKAADLKAAVDRHAQFRPARLLFTRLDETASPGTVVSEAIRTRIPVSFLTRGQRIPEDLEEATPEALLDLALAGNRGRRPLPAAGRAAAA